MRSQQSVTFSGLRPKSRRTSRVARASSKKRNTRCEVLLRQALWARGLRYRLYMDGLVGCPDIVFAQKKIAVFVDGDFWHGRNLESRIRKLRRGHNPNYWVNKIRKNVERDRRVTKELKDMGWHVIRVWEGDIRREKRSIVESIVRTIESR